MPDELHLPPAGQFQNSFKIVGGQLLELAFDSDWLWIPEFQKKKECGTPKE
jgi:hypothetical protein